MKKPYRPPQVQSSGRDGDPTRPIGSDNRTELQRLRAENDRLQLRLVMIDKALEEQNFAGVLSDEQRAELMKAFRHATECGDTNACGEEHNGFHAKNCYIARWLRVLGGDEETQRQVDAAHEAAIETEAVANIRRFDVTFDEQQLRQLRANGARLRGVDVPDPGNVIRYVKRPDGTIARLEDLAAGNFMTDAGLLLGSSDSEASDHGRNSRPDDEPDPAAD